MKSAGDEVDALVDRGGGFHDLIDSRMRAADHEHDALRGIVPVGLVFALLAIWLPPLLDRRERWVIDGDAVRWLGLALLVVGGVLRVWPMFVLGRRFSGLVAIQEGHQLVTDGVYPWIRD